MAINNSRIESAYQSYLESILLNNIYTRILITLTIMFVFVLNDIYVIKVIESAYLRFLVIIPAIFLLLLKLFKDKGKNIFRTYIILLLMAQVMMYSKLIVHLGDPAQLNLSILGTILIIFIVSLELRINYKYSIFFYVVPFIIYLILLYYKTTSLLQLYRILLNIFPIVIIGFIANVYYNKLIFNEFKSNYLLEEEKLIVENQNEELKVLNKTKDRFFSIISHDIKNPFNIIMGFSEVLKDSYDTYSDKERKHFINEINNSSIALYELLDNLLQWSSIQLNGIRLKPELIEINSLFSQIISTQKLNANSKNITLLNLVDKNITVTADKYSIVTVISNLISNSIKFSYLESNIEINAYIKDSKLLLSVKDFGVGMNNEKVNKLFKIDKNVSTNGTNNEKGSGIGLILCTEISKLNKGKLWVDSKVNEGSTFYFSLPI